MFEKVDWVGAGLAALPLPAPRSVDDADLPRQLTALLQADGDVYAEQLTTIAEMHSRHVQPSEDADARVIDAWAELEAQISAVLRLPPAAARNAISEALAVRDRLPCLERLLRDGTVSKRHAQQVVRRTNLIDDGSDEARRLNEAVSAIFAGSGSWSDRRIRDLVDKAVLIIDASAVRRRRRQAKDERRVVFSNLEDGMSEMLAVLSTDDAAAIRARVEQFAKDVCRHDSRTAAQRRADAVVAAMLGRPALECDCGRDDCTAASREILSTAAELSSDILNSCNRQIVVHLVIDQQTLDGDADNPAVLEGHGVISADHARDIANQPDAVVRPVVVPTASATPPATSAGAAAAGSRSVAPGFERQYLYSPNRALDDYVRIRDGYCTWPYCNHEARYADIDHTEPFDKDDPKFGGLTTHVNLKALCRFHHLLKTFGRWADSQTGNTDIEFIAPDGTVYPGPAACNVDLFPGLATHQHADTALDRRLNRQRQRSAAGPPVRGKPRASQRSDRKRYERNRNAREAIRAANTARTKELERWQQFVGYRPPPF